MSFWLEFIIVVHPICYYTSTMEQVNTWGGFDFAPFKKESKNRRPESRLGMLFLVG